MKIILSAIIASSLLFATGNSVESAFEKGLLFEKQGDIHNAMLWYKKAARLKLENKSALQRALGSNAIDNRQKVQNTTSKSKSSKKEPLLFGIETYKSNYLLPYTYDGDYKNGRQRGETKFQISLKKALFHDLLGLDETLYGAYTQTSWWQTGANSAPFRETNYAPELFIKIPFASTQSVLQSYKIGLLHESNGQGGELSRSWNRLYLSGNFAYENFTLEPRIWYRLKEETKKALDDGNGDDNPDIHNYLGYGDIKLALAYEDHIFSMLLRNNLRFDSKNKGAVQFNWTFPLWNMQGVYGYLQYFSGYGESLIDYDKQIDRIGVGFAVSR